MDHVKIPDQFAGLKTKHLDPRVARQLATKAENRTMTAYLEQLVLDDLGKQDILSDILHELRSVSQEVKRLTAEVSRIKGFRQEPIDSEISVSHASVPLAQVSDDVVKGRLDPDDLDYVF